jgi:hypothetical protein
MMVCAHCLTDTERAEAHPAAVSASVCARCGLPFALEEGLVFSLTKSSVPPYQPGDDPPSIAPIPEGDPPCRS